MSEFKKESPV